MNSKEPVASPQKPPSTPGSVSNAGLLRSKTSLAARNKLSQERAETEKTINEKIHRNSPNERAMDHDDFDGTLKERSSKNDSLRERSVRNTSLNERSLRNASLNERSLRNASLNETQAREKQPPRQRTRENSRTSFDIELAEVGGDIFHVMQIVREITGLSFKETQALVESAPRTIASGVSQETADSIKAKFRRLDAVINIRQK
jgi:ribosomal protein L7/L12